MHTPYNADCTLGINLSGLKLLQRKRNWYDGSERIKQKESGTFAQQLQQKHAPQNWKVMKRTVIMLTAIGTNNPYSHRIGLPAIRPAGSFPNVAIGIEDSTMQKKPAAVYEQLPNGSVGILPAAPMHWSRQTAAALLAGNTQKNSLDTTPLEKIFPISFNGHQG